MSRKTILIFGGNGFIGSETVEYLLANNQNLDIILVNRGNWNEWDQSTRIKDRITKNIICDRKKDSIQASLKDYLEDDNFKFEAVIDFSAYKKRVLKNALNDIPINKIKLYILISTDSVYEVSSISKLSNCLDENDAVRPDSKIEIKKLKKFDSYGHHKLKCEEFLIKYSKEKGLNYIILRLPDVIGMRDSTNRFWMYQMWLEYLYYSKPNEKHEIVVPKHLNNLKTSYVYVKDIAKVINEIIGSDIRNETFNIAYERQLSLIEFFQILADKIDTNLKQNLAFIVENDENFKNVFDAGFPSVTKGPLNTNKIRDKLNFKSTDLIKSFHEVIEFYDRAYTTFPEQRKIIEKDIKRELLKSEAEKVKFEEFINYKIKSINDSKIQMKSNISYI